MNMSIEKMLSHVYEIEGLMLVTRRLGEENTPDVITNKIKRKVRELAEMCDVDIAPKPDEPNEPNTDTVPSMDSRPTEPAAPVTEHLPEEDYDADETWQHDNGEEFKEVFALDYMEPEHDEKPAYDNPVPVADREPDEDITVEFIEAPDELTHILHMRIVRRTRTRRTPSGKGHHPASDTATARVPHTRRNQRRTHTRA